MIRKIMTFIVVVLISLTSLSYAQSSPMEAIKKYNVILVHGASNSDRGIEALCNARVEEAYNHHQHAMLEAKKHGVDTLWNLGEAVTMMGGLNTKDTLTHWLDTEIFERYRHFKSDDPDGASPIYIQRSFVNPANSPIANARELGDPTWKGENYCVERRSLIEEAQVVKVGGRENLKDLRTSKNYFDIPSRNILTGYSMGGVASSEYVRGTSI